MKALWVNGWGVGRAALQDLVESRYPNLDHICVDPVETWKEEAYRSIDDVDWILGYSTGAFLLLREERLLKMARRAMLFAPFVDFRSESGLGGKTRRVQLEILIRRLRKDPLQAVSDFYSRASLSFSNPATLPYSQEGLLWGIEQLKEERGREGCLLEIPACIGETDALLDSDRIASLGGEIETFSGVGHDLAGLLHFWKGFE